MTSSHIPVMVQEVLCWLHPEEGSVYIDCTVGGGGHSKAILEKLKGKVNILGIAEMKKLSKSPELNWKGTVNGLC